jgi:hypothetical protein
MTCTALSNARYIPHVKYGVYRHNYIKVIPVCCIRACNLCKPLENAIPKLVFCKNALEKK